MEKFPLVPEQASEHASRPFGYDWLFFTITGLTVVFTIIVGLLVLVLAVRYRRGTKVNRSNPPTHNTILELSWTVLPLVIAIGIFAWSSINFIGVRQMPKDAVDVFVIGKQWMWHVQHMDGTRENNELHIPVGKPIKMTMISQDVIHAMYLPEFRAQYHVVPGRYTQLSFTPTKTGKFKMLCGMHCGTDHSQMWGYVYVLSESEYAEWLDGQKGNRFNPKAKTMVDAGKDIWDQNRCFTCHTGENTVRGPSLNGIFGGTRTFEDGSSAVADEDYLRQSIVDPSRRLVKGYDPTMQAYQDRLTEEDILSLIEYIKTMGTASPDGEKAPVEQERPTPAPGPTAPQNATDIANKKSSANASQAEELRDR